MMTQFLQVLKPLKEAEKQAASFMMTQFLQVLKRTGTGHQTDRVL